LNEWVYTVTDGRYPELSLQFVLGVVLSPVAWLIGTPAEDAMRVGQLLGEKTILNEFYAYATMGGLKADGAFSDPKSVIIATYALCGFANFASIGIQIGGIGSLAPSRRKDLSELAVLSLVGGTLACLMTACVAGMLV
jgi:CNT family concentrative nucleoside transporter